MRSFQRSIMIGASQLRGNSTKDSIALFANTLFSTKKILVYSHLINSSRYNVTLPAQGVDIRKGRLHDILSAEIEIQPLPWEFQCHNYDGAQDFFVATYGSKILHISWIYYSGDRNRLLRLQKDEAEIKYCLTLPPARGKGIYPAVIKKIVQYLAESGIRQVFMCVYPDNYPSIRGIEKAMFRKIGNLRLSKVLGIQISGKLNTARLPT